MSFHKLNQRLNLRACGEIEAIQTRWTLPTQFRGGERGWERSRKTGGGVLFEIAVHHFDLWRCLFATEIEEIFAFSTPGRTPDQTVTISARLANGVLASALFSERSADGNDIDICGQNGRLTVSVYSFDGYQLTPTGASAGGIGFSLKRSLNSLSQFPQGFSTMRRGGEYELSYEAEWQHFFACIRSNTEPSSSLHDGRQALAAVLAAMESAENSRPIAAAGGI